MKILQVMPEFALAGAERMAENLTLQLKKNGYDVEVVSLYDYHSAITENLEKNGIKIHYLGKRKGLDLSMYFKLTRLFMKLKPSVVHTHRYVAQYTMPACILAGIRGRVHTIHTMASEESSQKKLQNIFFHKFKLIPVGISDTVQKSICDFYKLTPERVPMVFNGIDIDRYAAKTSYEQNGKFRFVHIGRFALAKNHKNIVKAFKILSEKYDDVELHFIGEGELLDETNQLITDLGMKDKIILHGVMNNINTEMCKYDSLILPSVYEGMPITLIEAMAVGMPIAASAVGGIPDMIEDKISGILCSPDCESIAGVMEKLYLDKELRAELGDGAKKAADRFSAGNMAKGYIEIYGK